MKTFYISISRLSLIFLAVQIPFRVNFSVDLDFKIFSRLFRYMSKALPYRSSNRQHLTASCKESRIRIISLLKSRLQRHFFFYSNMTIANVYRVKRGGDRAYRITGSQFFKLINYLFFNSWTNKTSNNSCICYLSLHIALDFYLNTL